MQHFFGSLKRLSLKAQQNLARMLPCTTLYKLCDDITVVEGLLVRGVVVIPPATLGSRMIALEDEAHLGFVPTKKTLREGFWWRKRNSDGKSYIKSFYICKQTN